MPDFLPHIPTGMAPGHLKANVRSALGDALLTLCTALSTVLSLPVRWALGPPVFPSSHLVCQQMLLELSAKGFQKLTISLLL